MVITKKQAVAEFRETVMPHIRQRYERDGTPDYPARCEAWSEYTDALRRDRRISGYQFATWAAPRFVDRRKF